MRPCLVSPEVIAEAKKLYAAGMGCRAIGIKLGFTDEWHVRYHIDDRRRLKQQEIVKRYYKKNRKAVLAKMQEYNKVYKLRKALKAK